MRQERDKAREERDSARKERDSARKEREEAKDDVKGLNSALKLLRLDADQR